MAALYRHWINNYTIASNNCTSDLLVRSTTQMLLQGASVLHQDFATYLIIWLSSPTAFKKQAGARVPLCFSLFPSSLFFRQIVLPNWAPWRVVPWPRKLLHLYIETLWASKNPPLLLENATPGIESIWWMSPPFLPLWTHSILSQTKFWNPSSYFHPHLPLITSSWNIFLQIPILGRHLEFEEPASGVLLGVGGSTTHLGTQRPSTRECLDQGPRSG